MDVDGTPPGKDQLHEVGCPFQLRSENVIGLLVQAKSLSALKSAIGAHAFPTGLTPVAARFAAVHKLFLLAVAEVAAALMRVTCPAVNLFEQYEYSM